MRIHDIVGDARFATMTNAEIMRERALGKQIRQEVTVPSEAAKACLDRIRRAMHYPLSRQVQEKRSTQQMDAVKNGQ